MADLFLGMKFGLTLSALPYSLEVAVYFCGNLNCDCANLYFYKTDGYKKLFKINLNIAAWDLVSTELFSYDDDYPRAIYAFMVSPHDKLQKYIQDGKREAISFGGKDSLREEIGEDVNTDNLVYYRSVFESKVFPQLSFEHKNTHYFVADYYCAKPACDCHAATLYFQVIEGDKAVNPSVLEIRYHFKTGEREILSQSVSDRLAGTLYKRFVGSLLDEGITLYLFF